MMRLIRCYAPRKDGMNDQRAGLAPCRKELQGRRTQYPEGTMSRPTGLRPTVILSLFCEESLFRGSSNKILHFVQDHKKMRLLRRWAPRKDE